MINFVNNNAKYIYDQILSQTEPPAKEKVETLFSLMAGENGDKSLNEEEARKTVDLLNQYNQSMICSLQISYSEKNIDLAIAEFEAWNRCFNLDPDEESTFRFGEAENSHDFLNKHFEEFINNFPHSQKIQEAYYRLGQSYQMNTSEYNKAINTFERLICLYPKSKLSSQALVNLFHLYNITGDEDRLISTYSRWMKSPSYTPVSFFYQAPSYAEVKSGLMLGLAEYYKHRGQIKEATTILNQIIPQNNGLATIAKGSLFEITKNPAYNKYFPAYQKYRRNILLEQAAYLLFEKNAPDEAGRIYNDIAKMSKEIKKDLFSDKANTMLQYISLLSVFDSYKAVDVFRELVNKEATSELLAGLGHCSPLNGISANAYLLVMLLKRCLDVQEVKISSDYLYKKIDSETKTVKEASFIAFKRDNVWQIIDADNMLNQPIDDLNAETLEELLDNVPALKYSSPTFITVEEAPLVFTSLKEFGSAKKDRNHFDLSRKLSMARLPERVQDISDKTGSKLFAGQAEKKDYLGLVKAYYLLPRYHFNDLFVYINNDLPGDAGGIHLFSRIELPSAHSHTTVFHEMAHHWDILTVGNDGKNLSTGDPSLLFYKINWSGLSRNNDGWIKRKDSTAYDFPSNYGRKNGREDLATSAQSYYEDTDGISRQETRHQMKIGNFKPAIRYLFNKYIRSYDPIDGLCFEYNLSDKSPPLSFKEVKDEMKNWLSKPGRKIPRHLREITREIETTYQYFKSLPLSYWENLKVGY